ncbi:ABC transporter substrate-binding protein [candidate division WOR-3 bacterium]|nr:ABC transporter substrate-binding protein [candidate division WOR-3 bacterium]
MKRFFCLKWLVCVLVIALLAIFVANIGCKKQIEEIKIGAILPLSGNTAWMGEQHKWGLDLAIEDINSAGGVNGMKLRVIYEDDKNEPLQAVNAFNKMARSHHPSIIISALSNSSMAILPLAEKEKVVLFANCGHPEIAERSKWVFRDFLTGVQEAEAMAKLCVEELDIKEVALLYINDAYGEGGKNIFEKAYPQYGGRILMIEKYDKDGTDFRTEIAKVLGTKPEAVYLFGYGNATGIALRQLRELGYKGIILGTNNFSGPPVTDLARDAIEGAIFTAPYFTPEIGEENIQKFVQRVKTRFGKEPYWNTAVEYDAIYIIAEAIKIAKKYDGESLRKALEKVGDFEGIGGKYSYHLDGEWRLKLTVRTYKHGDRVPYEIKKRGG